VNFLFVLIANDTITEIMYHSDMNGGSGIAFRETFAGDQFFSSSDKGDENIACGKGGAK
jgi:hypothetical protein